jgi:hypothetical protein
MTEPLIFSFTLTTTLTSLLRLSRLRKERSKNRLAMAWQEGMLLVAAPVAFILLVESFL